MELGSELKQLVNTLESHRQLYEDGRTLVLLSTNEHRAINEYIELVVETLETLPFQEPVSTRSLRIQLEEYLMSTYESVALNSEPILSDRPGFFKHDSEVIVLLRTLAADSILKDAVFCGLLTRVLEERLKKLWLPVKTGCADSDLTWSSTCLNSAGQESWFSTMSTSRQKPSSQKTFLPYFKFLHAAGTGSASTVLKTRKVRLRLTSTQKNRLDQWRHACRYTYNAAVEMINSSRADPFPEGIWWICDTDNSPNPNREKLTNFVPWMKKTKKTQWIKNYGITGSVGRCPNVKVTAERQCVSKLEARDLLVPNAHTAFVPWLADAPTCIREGAVFEAYKNLQSALTNLARGNINHFKLGWASKREPKWTLTGIDDGAYKRLSARAFEIFTKYSLGTIKTTENVPLRLDHEMTIHFDGLRYYACFIESGRVSRPAGRKSIVSCDPGIRTFGTFYDVDDEEYLSVAPDAHLRIDKLLFALDNLMRSKAERTGRFKHLKLTSSQRTCKIRKLRARIQNLQSELHNKVIKWLTDTYDTVLMPKLDTRQISAKNNRVLHTKSIRRMSALAHGKFLARLKTKAIERDVHVVTPSEAYTTKTCGNCFTQNHSIGAKKEWQCGKCTSVHFRDINAARNILLKQFDFLGMHFTNQTLQLA